MSQNVFNKINICINTRNVIIRKTDSADLLIVDGHDIDDVYEKLRKEGKVNLDSIIKWMQEAKIVDKAKTSEEEVLKLFADVKDQEDVPLNMVKEAVKKLIEETSKVLEAERFWERKDDQAETMFQEASAAASMAARRMAENFRQLLPKRF